MSVIFYPNSIPIIFSSNDYYVPYMAAMMQSIMENANTENKYSFFILHLDIPSTTMGLLKRQIASYPHFSLDFINVTQYFKDTTFFVSRHITLEAYFRLLIPFLFADYKKAIYLDGDMICFTDIFKLYDIDLNDNLIAAVRDTAVAWYYKPKHTVHHIKLYDVLLHLKNPEEYFCSGMIIFNIDLFCKRFTMKELFDLALSQKWPVHDQDVMNYLCQDKVLILPYHWNYMYTNDYIYLPEHLKNEYLEAEKSPKIIHFKPWTHGNCSPYEPHSEYFWKYSAKTPFFDTIITRMKEKKILASEHDVKEQIYLDIKSRRIYGIDFILKCFFTWLFGHF